MNKEVDIFDIDVDNSLDDCLIVDEYYSDKYCHTECEFYKFCYANHEICIKRTFENVLNALTPREKQVIMLRFGLYDGKCRTVEDVAREFGLTCDRICHMEAKALRKLRFPSRVGKLKRCFYGAFAVSNNDLYARLLKAIFGDNECNSLDISLGLNCYIVDMKKNQSKSIRDIKNELNTNITDIDSLRPYLKYLTKIEITTLEHLLYTPSSKLLFTAFEKNDVLFFDLIKVLSSMGYKIINYQDKMFDDVFVEELMEAGVNTSIYEQPLDELPLGIVLRLYDNNITTVRELLNNIYIVQHLETLTDEMKKQIDDFLLAKNLCFLHCEDKFYLTPIFWNCFLKSLVCYLRENSHSISLFKKELEELNSKIDNSIIQIVQNKYGEYNFMDIACIFSKASVTIDKLDFSVRTYNCLTRAGIHTIGDIVSRTYEELQSIRSMGKLSLEEIMNTISSYDLKLVEKNQK